MDKPAANPDLVKQQLTEYELVPEEWGGDVPCIPVSAHTKMGIDDLLEMILLVAEMKELKANPDRAAKGTVIEARLDKAAARLRPSSCRTVRCIPATSWSQVPRSAVFAP